MLGVNVKRGVATTLERVFNASGNQFDKLEVLWTGRTAGIIFERGISYCNAKVIFPSIDETSQIPEHTFNNLIGYALHELGHAWYTDNRAWDRARDKHGKFVSNLINGLEDPRIERKVIESGRAPNSRCLFENLLDSVLTKDGYVKPDDKQNIPFLLAVEGRRLNGYSIRPASIVNDSPWAKHLHWALKKAHVAPDTATIVKIAVELFRRIREQEEQGRGQQEQDGEGQPSDGQPSNGQPSDGEGQPSDKPSEGGNPSDKPSDEQGDGEKGEGEGQPSDGQPSDGQPSDEKGEGDSDEPSDGNGDGYSSEEYDGGREVEPSNFIEDELVKVSKSSDAVSNRPSVGKPRIETFHWR
jgi:hypothetical protein